MATQKRMDPRLVRTDGQPSADSEPQLRDLLRQLAAEGSALLRNEMALAKLEMREMGRELAIDSAKVATALALALVGGLAVTTAAIIALGNLLGGMYALSALIIGVVLLAAGAIFARSGIAGLKKPPRPEQTVQTMKDNREWARDEVQHFKEEIRS
jgi:hypothetical protein